MPEKNTPRLLLITGRDPLHRNPRHGNDIAPGRHFNQFQLTFTTVKTNLYPSIIAPRKVLTGVLGDYTDARAALSPLYLWSLLRP